MYLEKDFPGNCGIFTLSDFDAVPKKKKGQVTDWLYALNDAGFRADVGVVAFSGAEYQNRHATGPFALVTHLKELGEDVVESGTVKNKSTGNNIQAFLWTPSKAFYKAFIKWQAKFNKLTEYERVCIEASHYGESAPDKKAYASDGLRIYV